MGTDDNSSIKRISAQAIACAEMRLILELSSVAHFWGKGTENPNNHCTRASTRTRSGSNSESGTQGIMVTLAWPVPHAQILTKRLVGTIAEYVVHASHGRARIDVGQALVHLDDARGMWLGVEVAHQDDHISLLCVLANHTHDVQRCSRSSASAALTYSERTVVIDEENDFSLAILQSNPLRTSLAVILILAVLADEF